VVAHFLNGFNHRQKSWVRNTKAAKGKDGHNMYNAIKATFGIVGDDDSLGSGCPNEVVGEVLVHADFHCTHVFAAPKIVTSQGVGPFPIPHGSVTDLFVACVVVAFQAQDGAHLVGLVIPSALQQLDIHTKLPLLNWHRTGIAVKHQIGPRGGQLVWLQQPVHGKR